MNAYVGAAASADASTVPSTHARAYAFTDANAHISTDASTNADA